MSANYWEDKVDFWGNKTKDNPVYDRQKREVRDDILKIVEAYHIKRVIDVGGYKGELGQLLPDGIEYINIDFTTGVDITKPWLGQKGMTTFKKVKGTLTVASLVLVCLSPDDAAAVVSEMKRYSDLQYFFEEQLPDGKEYGQQINDAYGGKWVHDLSNGPYLDEPHSIRQSAINKRWIRVLNGGYL